MLSYESGPQTEHISERLTVKMVRHRVPMTLRNFFFSDPFFRNTWTDFDKVEREFMKESRNLFKALEHASQRQEKVRPEK